MNETLHSYVKCIKQLHCRMLLMCCYLLFLVPYLPRSASSTSSTVQGFLHFHQQWKYHSAENWILITSSCPALHGHFRGNVSFFIITISQCQSLTDFYCSTKTSSWALPPALAGWTPHYWGTTASSPVSHHTFHSVQWCLKKTRTRIKYITRQTQIPACILQCSP